MKKRSKEEKKIFEEIIGARNQIGGTQSGKETVWQIRLSSNLLMQSVEQFWNKCMRNIEVSQSAQSARECGESTV